MRIVRPLLSLLALATLAACGTAGAVAPAPRPGAPAPTPFRPEPPALLPLPGDEGDGLLVALRHKLASATSVEALVRSTSQGHFKAGKRVDELRRSTYRTKLLWQKPSRFAGDILETDNFLVGGAKMASTDGKRIRVRAKGLLSWFPVTLDANDPLLSSNRNHGFAEMTPEALMNRLMGPQASWTVIAKDARGVRIEVSRVRRADPAITAEYLTIAPGALTLVNLTMLEGRQKVAEFEFERFRWNAPVPKNAFEI